MPNLISLGRHLAVLAAPLALAAGLASGQAAHAVEAGPLTLAQGDASGFSEDKLDDYAAAVLKVQDVHDAWKPQIDEASSEEEARSMARQATDEMVEEIEAEGLTVDEYNAITQAAEQDEQLYQRIMTLLAEAR